jgi:hypothetical protein
MKIHLDQDTLQRIADECAEILQKQIRAGLDANGSPFTGGVDLRESDRFVNSIEGRLGGEGGEVYSDVAYAEILQGRYNWAGIAPQYWAELETRIQPIIAEGITLVEE